MLTARACWFFFAAFLFYLFANQTQIGWLYTVTALLAGSVFAAWFVGWGSVRKITGRREILPHSPTPSAAGDEEQGSVDVKAAANRTRHILPLQNDLLLHEGAEIAVTLTLENRRGLPAAQLNVTEHCPLADPTSEQHRITMFVPAVPARGSLAFTYEVTLHRRGMYQFPPVTIKTRAPFGFIKRQRQIELPTPCLILPEFKRLERLPLLDKQVAAQWTYPKTGQGSEILGVRPYRPGDSPRHIHWRSVARTGQLISKEFAEETQPGLTLILDRYTQYAVEQQYWAAAHPAQRPAFTKHTPFEMAVKCATSIADYALRRRFALYLVAASQDYAHPNGALNWDVLMQYLARVPAQSEARLPGLLADMTTQQYVAVCLSYPDMGVVEPLGALRRRGVNVLAVIPDAASFPLGGANGHAVAGALQSIGVETRVIQHGDDWSEVLSVGEPASAYNEASARVEE